MLPHAKTNLLFTHIVSYLQITIILVLWTFFLFSSLRSAGRIEMRLYTGFSYQVFTRDGDNPRGRSPSGLSIGRGFVHTSRSTEVTCRNKLRQDYVRISILTRELFVIRRATVDLTVGCVGRPKLLVG